MSSLQHKLWREIWHIRGQVLAIMLVITGGVAVCIMSLSTYDSLLHTRDTFYRDYAFADLFVDLKRAPQSMLARLAEIPGVDIAESGVLAQVNLQVPGFNEPASGLLVSIPDHGQPQMNRLHLMAGRLPDSRRDNEVVVSDAFAEAHDFTPGDSLSAVIRGRFRDLRIVGIATSPAYVYQIAPGAILPDYQRFGVLWMARTPLAAAYGMQGAFNHAVFRLQKDADPQAVMDAIDRELAHYGSRGTYDRSEQYSNQFLQEEFKQLQTTAYLFPLIFLAVAVFLINVVISRLINTQKEIIAILKAFGYSNGQIAWHYAQLVLLITGLGIITGTALGMYLGQLMTELYIDYYRFPDLLYSLDPVILVGVALACCLASLTGCMHAVWQAATLPPAEAMRPEKPAHYRKTWLEKSLLRRWLSPSDRMIMRHLGFKPVKTALAVIGLAMATAIMMVGNFQQDAIKLMMHVQFQLTQKQDIEVSLYEPVSSKALGSFYAIEGVNHVEGTRNAAVRLHFQNKSHRTGIQGLPADATLQQVLDQQLKAIQMPEKGLMLTDHLADKIGARAGDIIEVEFLDGKQQTRRIVVSELSRQFLGLGAYMQRQQLNRLLGEGPAVNTVLLAIDERHADNVYRALKNMPMVAGVNLRQTVIDSFYQIMEQMVLIFTFVNAALGGVIAFGVVYNTVRIALAEHGRELASLRVLGYTQPEVAYILLGELVVLTLVSLPLGFWIGEHLCRFMADNMQSDLFRVPLVLNSYTYAFSALVVMLSAAVSAWIVWRRLHKLDLVEVLKTRE